jgi:hypothetical protein
MSRPAQAARPAQQPAARPAQQPAARPANLPARANNPGSGNIARPSQPINRPSINLPAPGQGAVGGNAGQIGNNLGNRPATGAIGSRVPAGAGPSQGQLGNFLNNGNRPSTLPAGPGNRVPGSNPAIGDFLNNRPSQGNLQPGNRLPGDRVTGDRLPANRPDNRLPDNIGAKRDDLRNNISDNRGQRQGNRQEQLGKVGDNIRDHINDHYDHNHIFDNFWSNHPHWHYHFHQNPAFWSWVGFNTLASAMPWNWGQPIYYDYGSGGNVVYQGDTVYIDNTAYPAAQYDEQVAQLATNPPQPVGDPEWMPLGVFALTNDNDPDAVPNMFLQLAVSKEGILAGAYQNKATDQVQEIEGAVDGQTQRAAWTIVGKDTPIMETGVYNLTLNETRALVHFANGTTQQWLMVRLEPPPEEAAQ